MEVEVGGIIDKDKKYEDKIDKHRYKLGGGRRGRFKELRTQNNICRYHYASCYYDSGVYQSLYPPGPENLEGNKARFRPLLTNMTRCWLLKMRNSLFTGKINLNKQIYP